MVCRANRDNLTQLRVVRGIVGVLESPKKIGENSRRRRNMAADSYIASAQLAREHSDFLVRIGVLD